MTLEPCALTGPTVVHWHNPLNFQDRDVFKAESDTALWDLVPKTKLPTICLVNGEYVLREDWDLTVGDGDHVLFATLPQGGGDSNPIAVIIGIVLIVVGAWTGNWQVALYGAAMLVTGLITPATQTPLLPSNMEAASPTYNIALAGNQARLGGAIPVPYGRHIILPDFASQPYSEYDSNSDQYYHAILNLGQIEKHTIESIMIDDTPIDHFTGVTTQLLGPPYPGVTLSLDHHPAVVNAPEIANQELLRGTYVGPFAICGPGLQVFKISYDIACPKGLYFADDTGALQAKTISWMIEYRKINDAGTPIGPWVLLDAQTMTMASNTPIRRTFHNYVLPGRFEVRMTRNDEKDTNQRAAHDIQWLGLRGNCVIEDGVVLDPTCVFLAIRIKANNQLSGLSQRRIMVIQRRWLKTWHPDTGWSDYQDTQSIAWAAADVLKNETYGAGLPDSRIDLQTLYELDQIWKTRGDKFNMVFDKRITVWAALQSIMRAGRAKPIMRGSVFTFSRDQKQTLPVAMFTMRNIVKDSFTIDYRLPKEDDPDGLEIQFFNETKWDSDYVRIPLPGVTECLRPATGSMEGITSKAQVERETTHMVYDSFYRRATVSFDTELDGVMPAFGELIGVAHDVTSWGQSGEMEMFDPTTQNFVATEDVTLSTSSNNYGVFNDQFGDVHGPYRVAAGSLGTRSIQILDAIDFEPYTGVEKLRTRYSIGPADKYVKLCKLVSISPKDDDTVTLTAVVEDDRVHFDHDFVSGSSSGVAGRGGDGVARYAPDDVPTYDSSSDDDRSSYGFYADEDTFVGTSNDAGYKYGD
jgi:hypothetical protein